MFIEDMYSKAETVFYVNKDIIQPALEMIMNKAKKIHLVRR